MVCVRYNSRSCSSALQSPARWESIRSIMENGVSETMLSPTCTRTSELSDDNMSLPAWARFLSSGVRVCPASGISTSLVRCSCMSFSWANARIE